MNARRLPTRTGGPRRCGSFQMVAHARERTVGTPRGRPPECRQADGRPIRRSRSSARRQGRRSTRPPRSNPVRPARPTGLRLPTPGPAQGEKWRSGRIVPLRAPSHRRQNRAITRKTSRASEGPTRMILPERHNRGQTRSPRPLRLTVRAAPRARLAHNHETGRVVHGGKDV